MAAERDDESGPTAIGPVGSTGPGDGSATAIDVTAIASTLHRPLRDDESGPTVPGPNAPAPSNTFPPAPTAFERPARRTSPPPEARVRRPTDDPRAAVRDATTTGVTAPARPAAISARPIAERTDLQLLEGWRAGDATAGEALVARHWASISRFFRGKIGDDGADLISQTFLACVEGRDRIEGDNVKAYLFAVARRRLADMFRTRARRPEIDFSVSSVIDLGTGPVTFVSRREQADILRDALARIPMDDQIALELAYFEGMPTREIAGVLEIPENTVRSRLSRAREKLRAALQLVATPAEAALAESALDARS